MLSLKSVQKLRTHLLSAGSIAHGGHNAVDRDPAILVRPVLRELSRWDGPQGHARRARPNELGSPKN